jgi:choline dehydrogenase-like flavoprotein
VHAVVSDLAMARGVPWVVTPSAVASGVGPATLARDPVSGRRWTTLDVLEPFRSPGSRRVEVRAGIEVDRLLWGAGSRVEGVRAADGTVVEADLVTLCSGTFGSATLLLRSGIETVAGDTGVGRGITDHPSVSMSLPLTDSSRRGRTGGAPGPSPRDSSGPLRCLWRAGALQLLPMSSSGPGEGERATAAVLLALMRPRSTGHLRLDDEGRAVVDLGSYGDADGADLQTMRRGVRLLLDLAEAPRLRRVADGAWFGDGATPPEHVNGLLGEPDALRTWLLGQHGRHVHATSGCAMGSVVDATGRVTTEDAQVLPGLRIADLSVLPDVATANPMWSAMLVAERIAELVAVTS